MCSIIVKTFPSFYQELIELWCKISYQEPSNITQIYNQCQWNNSFIVTQVRLIFIVLEDIHVNEITPPIFSKKFSDVCGWSERLCFFIFIMVLLAPDLFSKPYKSICD